MAVHGGGDSFVGGAGVYHGALDSEGFAGAGLAIGEDRAVVAC